MKWWHLFLPACNERVKSTQLWGGVKETKGTHVYQLTFKSWYVVLGNNSFIQDPLFSLYHLQVAMVTSWGVYWWDSSGTAVPNGTSPLSLSWLRSVKHAQKFTASED